MSTAPTIHDVARASGVSTSTVSRALARPERVNVRTREHVRRVAGQLGYHPSVQARSLVSGRTMTVALVLPDVTNPFFFGLIRGTQRRAAEAGYTQVLLDTEESATVEARRLAAIRKSVDGVVVAASRLSDTELATLAARQPLVALNRHAAGVDSVVLDTPRAYRDAVRHLAALGHRRLAYVAGPRSSWSDGRRWRAVRLAARSAGVAVSRIGEFAPTSAAGRTAADLLVDPDRRTRRGRLHEQQVTAVLAFNDLLALGILARLAERGVAVPGEVSVVGCDDIFGADFAHPPLTTLAAPVEQAGRLAVARLLELVDDPGRAGGSRQVLPAVLRVRGSTGPPRQAPGSAPPCPNVSDSPAGGEIL